MIKVAELVNNIEDDAIKFWHYLHSNPELSLKEYNTHKYLLDIIKSSVDYDKLQIVGETGILVELIGKKSKSNKIIGLRGDMDALPITEKTNLPFKSEKEGVMHACGHDVHTAILLSSLLILSEIKDQFSGKIVFIFQPAEETLQGAKLFVNDPKVNLEEIDGFVALHVIPDLYVGQIATRKGPILASADKFTIKIIGQQCHAAHPNRGVDPIVISASIINALQTIVSRNISPLDNGVVTVGKINGGTAHNIIPESLEMEGTIRTTNLQIRNRIHQNLEEISKGIGKSMGAEVMLNIEKGVPPVICDDSWVDRVFKVGGILLGEDNVINLSQPAMGGEDFAFLKENKPGVFIRLGVRSPGKEYGATHSSFFYTDEGAISVGIKTMLGMTLDYLGEEICKNTL